METRKVEGDVGTFIGLRKDVFKIQEIEIEIWTFLFLVVLVFWFSPTLLCAS